ncbi:hypothetical protein TKK_0003294 [Trichogramma kaykai]
MSIINYDEHLSIRERNYFIMKSEKDANKRRKTFCNVCYFDFEIYARPLRSPADRRICIELMNCKELFPSVEDKKYFLKYALHKRSLEMIKLLEEGNLKIHEVKFEDGRSALHYLTEQLYGKNEAYLCSLASKVETLKLVKYFLENPRKNYRDKSGYTYLHGACMCGNVSTVNLLLSQGVDVNLDTYTCSPLLIAAQYRHADIVEILLTHGANPNKRDAEKSTPLHALARLCLCQCTDRNRFCDKRKPVDKLVQMLIDHGADIEARNRHGYTPLGLSVSRLNLQLTRTFLKYGAKIDNLNENKIFNGTFTPLELKNYPLTLNIIEMAHLLKSAGYDLSLQARLRMMKYWMKIRGNDTDHLIGIDLNEFWPEYGFEVETETLYQRYILQKRLIHRYYGFYITQEAEDFMDQKCKELKMPHLLEYLKLDNCHLYFPQKAINDLLAQVDSTTKIILTEDVSLYKICQMSYSKGYSLIKGIKNWRLPAMDDISCKHVNIIAKRHLANVLIRPQLEWFVADLFMTDHCKLSLPYLACLKIAEHMSDEDLFRLCQQTDENQLRPNAMRRRKRCKSKESVASVSPEPPTRRSRRLRGLPANEDDF